MTAKEKAKELFDKFHNDIWESGNTISKPMLKKCALISVKEVLFVLDRINELTHETHQVFWRKVEEEINIL